MNGYLERLAGELTRVNHELDAEFEVRLLESSTLAFRVAYSVLRQREDAEDVAQEAFAKAYRNFNQLRDRTRFRAWLVRMTWRLAIDWRRGDKRRAAREIEHAKRASDPASVGSLPATATADARTADIWRAIDRLPEKLRVVVVMANIEGHELCEVAQLLDLPEGTIKSRLFLARKQLKEYLS